MTALLDGLAINSAAPADLLLRLLEPEYESTWPALAGRREAFPEAVIAAIVGHPRSGVRAALARNPFVDPEVRGRLVDDPDWLVRARLAGRPDRTRPVRPLPDRVIDRMLTTYDNECVSELLASRQIPFAFQLSYADHALASVRGMAVNVWTFLSEDQRAALRSDPDPGVRERVQEVLAPDDAEANERALGPLPPPRRHWSTHILVNRRLSPRVVDWLLSDPDPEHPWVLAHNHSTPPDVVAGLVAHPDRKVRLELARRADLDPVHVTTLARDPDPHVRTAVSLRPELSEVERASIAYEVDTDQEFGPCEHHARAVPDPAASAAHARSRHPLLRRRAARDPALPVELVALLARDDDPGVRLLLAHNHPEPPPDLLLRCYLEQRGGPRDLLLEHPSFPVKGLGPRFADAEAPDERRLALLDPDLAPETADRLTRDPDPAVRAGAARHPRLPEGRLTVLLGDDELSEHAAANPALPEPMMRALLTGRPAPGIGV
ncbi:translation initiation factor 2 [Streptomyces sp. NBC_01304]|uniref:translation initiation factor 2 n=1 Tax=Streptomyces sp. NBC_01304 TaxID=2903818 RepID=UPI002E13BA36|nr:translation initiation factor 2 [Streptomyces sp. NBC_01304]